MPLSDKQTLALCIPAYNADAFLPRLLKSALQQTIPIDEICVYDDCSTDDTAKIRAEFGAKVVSGDINRGCSFGKNTLAQKTSCDWIHFHDADDVLYPNFVEQAHKWMLQDDAPDVVFFNYECRTHDTNEKLGLRIFDDAELRRDPISYTIREQINPFCGLYRRTTFLQAGGWDTDPLVLQSEDQATHGKLARAGLSFAADHNVTVINYIRRNSMTTSNFSGAARATFHVMRKAAEAVDACYYPDVCTRLWGVAGVSASYLDWENADACVSLALSLNGRIPKVTSPIFKSLCYCNPHLAIRIRELLIRVLKPHLRSELDQPNSNNSFSH